VLLVMSVLVSMPAPLSIPEAVTVLLSLLMVLLLLPMLMMLLLLHHHAYVMVGGVYVEALPAHMHLNACDTCARAHACAILCMSARA
jgi:multidrug efflux pump subunit AcrB